MVDCGNEPVQLQLSLGRDANTSELRSQHAWIAIGKASRPISLNLCKAMHVATLPYTYAVHIHSDVDAARGAEADSSIRFCKRRHRIVTSM